eukprot:CAMPEP_0205809624 /NCGR_PEP_ID=MMETSP0205-20121125/13877_1 /ASSEMBLY_ACC=CAM_ASM_000278 /TAXON_ID=36767 /ORGANISM="Euplotes focardii, Strain TN1" /LENGTH=142 /DNA_ID=CAMNT_0053087087 /DNA_START=612 /DNA_END=1040 /DNA_ORIENTATION=+
MTGKDAGLFVKFYDNSLISYDRFSKALSAQDSKIRSIKSKIGIEAKCDSTERKLNSLMNPIPDKHIEKLFSDYLGKYETRGTRSMSNTEELSSHPSIILKPVFKQEFNQIQEVSEDRDTLAESENSGDIVNEFSQIFKMQKH